QRADRVFFQAEDGIRDRNVTGVQTCALPIFPDFGLTTKDTVIPRDVWENCSAALLKAEENWGIVELGYQFPESDRDAGKIKLVKIGRASCREGALRTGA